jgi:hypothetical protein
VTSAHPHQGYLLRAGDYLYAPSGKTYPSSYAAKNGKAADYDGHNARDGGCWGLVTADNNDYWWGPLYWSDPGDWVARFSATNAGANYDVYDYNITFMAEDGTYIYYVTDDNRIVKANSATFAQDWSKNFSYPYALIKAGDHLYAGGDGTLAAFTDSNGSRDWTANVTGKVYGLAAANGKLFVSTDAGIIYAFGVSSSLPDPATNPDPADDETGVSTGKVLSWTAGNGATSHDVYFGTASPPAFIQNQAGTEYSPPSAMATDTTHYWRIDEKNAQGTTTGTEWSFTTGSGADDYPSSDIAVAGSVSGSYTNTFASDDSYEAITEVQSGGKPANRYSYLEHKWAISVAGGSTVTFYVEAYHTSNSEGDDFIFAYSTTGASGTYTNMVTVTKTSDNDSAQSYPLPGSTSGTVHIRVVDTDQTAGNTALDTIYIDELHIVSGGASENPPDPATNPNPADDETGVDVDADLSWTAGAGTTSHDVYFGTASPPPFIQNQGSATYNPGTMDESTTYNWRIDEVNGNGTTTGTEWSFTTGGGACTPTDMHIEAVVCGTVSCGQGNKNGQATVTIYDDCGNPVTDALVDVTFTGSYSETIYDVATNGSGVAVITTSGCLKRPSFTATVIDVTNSLPYDSNDDVTDNCSN